MVLIIDFGNYDIKSILFDNDYNEVRRNSLPTLLDVGGSLLDNNTSNSLVQVSNGILGTGDPIRPLDDENEVTILEALLDVVYQDYYDDIDNILALIPVGIYNTDRERIKRSLSLYGINVEIFPQTACVDFDGLIIDIGGGTTDFVLKKDGSIKLNVSYPRGINYLLDKINMEILSKYKISIRTESLRDVILDKIIRDPSTNDIIRVDDIVERQVKAFWKGISRDINIKGLNSEKILVIGGGSNLIGEIKYETKGDPFYNILSLAYNGRRNINDDK